MTKKIIIIAVILDLIFIGAYIYFFVARQEINWVCENGQWVSHGKPSYPKPENPCGQKITLPRNKDECLQIEGVWKKQGPEPFETCNVKAKDRGTICHDNSECEGMCQVALTKDELSLGMRGSLKSTEKHGQCSVWVVELGCQGMMRNGKVQVICID